MPVGTEISEEVSYVHDDVIDVGAPLCVRVVRLRKRQWTLERLTQRTLERHNSYSSVQYFNFLITFVFLPCFIHFAYLDSSGGFRGVISKD